MRVFLIFLAFAMMFLTSCCSYCMHATVVRQAAFDHDCPKEKIKVIYFDRIIKAYKLDICGKVRKYRDIGDRYDRYIDVTQGMPKVIMKK